MGQQQLLLIILGTIIVGIAVAVGITMFNDQAAATNRDEVSNDLVHYASAAQSYYRRPRILGGGGGSFTGMSIKQSHGRLPAPTAFERVLLTESRSGGRSSESL